MAEVPMKVVDVTGTVPPMGREQIEQKLTEMMTAEGSAMAEKLPAEQKAKAEELLKKVQMFIGMANMWMNAMIADISATTVFGIESQYGLGQFLQYQAEFNKRLGAQLDFLSAQVLALSRRVK